MSSYIERWGAASNEVDGHDASQLMIQAAGASNAKHGRNGVTRGGAKRTSCSINRCNRRAAILEAACLQFARLGYDQVSVRKIARDVGIDHVLIYRHFGSKFGLFEAALDDCSRRARRRIQKTRDLAERLCALSSVDVVASPERELVEILVRSLSDREAFEAACAAVLDGVVTPIETSLSGQDRAAARAILSVVVAQGACLAQALAGQRDGVKAEIEVVVRQTLCTLLRLEI